MLTVDASQLQTIFGLGGAPVVMALVTILVKPFVPDNRFYPVAALVFGILLNVALAYAFGLPLAVAVFLGLLTGLAAAGVYSAGKTLQPDQPTPDAPDLAPLITGAVAAALSAMSNSATPKLTPAASVVTEPVHLAMPTGGATTAP